MGIRSKQAFFPRRHMKKKKRCSEKKEQFYTVGGNVH